MSLFKSLGGGIAAACTATAFGMATFVGAPVVLSVWGPVATGVYLFIIWFVYRVLFGEKEANKAASTAAQAIKDRRGG